MNPGKCSSKSDEPPERFWGRAVGAGLVVAVEGRLRGSLAGSVRRLAEDQEGHGGWRSRPRPSFLGDSPAWGRGPFTTMVKVLGLKAGLRSSFVLIGGLGDRSQNFHFGVVDLESTGVG